jgi:hypothetical protein
VAGMVKPSYQTLFNAKAQRREEKRKIFELDVFSDGNLFLVLLY